MNGEETEIPAEVVYWNIPRFKYAPITSADVERHFSA
jgi:hypothetical protein